MDEPSWPKVVLERKMGLWILGEFLSKFRVVVRFENVDVKMTGNCNELSAALSKVPQAFYIIFFGIRKGLRIFGIVHSPRQ
jgi:hypothetical protein